MIALGGGGSLLGRFVTELDAQSPAPVDPRGIDRSRYSAGDLEAARFAWAERIAGEHRSVIVFSDLLAQLATLQAPLPALACVQRIVGDELRHAVLCARVADWAGGLDDLEIDLSGLGPAPARATDSPGVRVLETIVRELVVVEAESVRMLAATRRVTTDPAVRSVLEVLVRDEARHAAAGQSLERLLWRHLAADDVAEAASRRAGWVEEERTHARRLYRRSATGGPGRALGAALEEQDLPAWEGAPGLTGA